METLEALEQNLQYTFNDRQHIQEALVHSSYAHENCLTRSNERLELLGDAVLHFALTEFLMETYREDSEGQLSALRSYCESEPFLCDQAIKLRLGTFIKLGKGEQLSGGAHKESLLADVFEAVVAAIHIDGGYKAAQSFILRHMKDEILEAHDKKLHIDNKSELQKLTQKLYRTLPEYTVVSETGLDHDKTFSVQVLISSNDKRYEAVGYGKNKKTAEKDAARAMLSLLH